MKNKIKVESSFRDIKNFINIPSNRKGIIEEAPETPINANFAVNSAANFLHPTTQYLKVKHVAEISKDVRAYVLEPDASHGTAKLAFFRPGQYLSITLNIGSAVVTRPFTICSSPLRSVDDEYVIIVKKIPHGFASTHIFNTWAKGTQIVASAPQGNFYYQKLRDSKNIIAVCDSNGISSFLSMAEAIADGTLDIDLTLLYSARKRNETIMTERLAELSESTDKFRVIYVFSDERADKCERGFVTKTLIEKYAPASKYSIFICGSTALYNRITPQIAELKLEKKYIRFGLSGQIINPASLSDFPKDETGKTYFCKVIKNGELVATIPCATEESLLVSLEREGIKTPSSCRSGECGFCRARLIKGNVFIPNGIDSRRLADSSHGIIHPCCSYPMSNLTLIIN